MKHKLSGLAVSVMLHGTLLAGAVLLLCQVSERSPVIAVANLVILPPEPKHVPTMAMPKTAVAITPVTLTPPLPKPPTVTPPPIPVQPPPPPQPPVTVPVPPPPTPPAPTTPDSPASGQHSQVPAPVSLPPMPPPATPPAPTTPDSPASGQRSQAPAPVVQAPDLTANSATAPENAYSALSDADYGRISSHLAPYIQRSYSRRANLRGWQGSVSVSFRITLDGQAADVRVEKSSGYDELDECALAAVRKAAPYPDLHREVRLLLPVTYKLR